MSLSTSELEAIIADKDRQLGRAQSLLERVVRTVKAHESLLGYSGPDFRKLAEACDKEARLISPLDYEERLDRDFCPVCTGHCGFDGKFHCGCQISNSAQAV